MFTMKSTVIVLSSKQGDWENALEKVKSDLLYVSFNQQQYRINHVKQIKLEHIPPSRILYPLPEYTSNYFYK